MPQRIMPRSKTFSLTILLAVLFCPQALFAASAATTEWNITADKITRLEHPRRIIGEGNVILEKRELQPPPKPSENDEKDDSWADILGEKNQPKKVPAAKDVVKEAKPEMRVTTVIKADWISYDVERKYIEAKGNISIVGDGDTLEASSGTVNLDANIGTFENAIIIAQEKDMHLEGKTVTKTGYNTYRIEKGWIITCKLKKGEIPPWSLVSSSTNIEKGGYAKLINARFQVRNVPIFYTPYLVVPVKNTRETGLLFPELSYSGNSGFGVNLPLFINLSHSADMTLFPEYLTQRGFRPGLEFRYALSDASKGVFFGQFLNDSLSNDPDYPYHTNTQRYWLYSKADAEAGNGWQVRLDMDIASDWDYLNEFSSGYTGINSTENRMLGMFGRGFDNYTSIYRDNRLVASKYWSGTSLTATLDAQNDLLENRPPGSSTPLWKLPSVAYNGALPFYSTGISLNWDTEYVNYWREDGVGANRLDLDPSINVPIPLSQYLESSTELGARDTYYQVQKYGDATWNYGTNQNRLLPHAQFDVATTLVREFANASFGGTALEHQIRPYVRYNWIPDIDQKKLPALDAVDQISQQSSITYGIDNFFNTIQNATSSQEYATFRIFQGYSLLDQDKDQPFQAIGARTTWTPRPFTSFEYDVYYDVYANVFSSHSVSGTYTTSRGDMFSIDYSYYDTTTNDFKRRLSYLQMYNTSGADSIEQINASVRTHITEHWLTQLDVQHSISNDTTQTFNVGLTYQAPCWSVQLLSQYNGVGTTYFVVFSLANLASDLGVQL